MKWDNYFLDICKTVATKSSCLSRQIGAILVKDTSILATGYNGPSRGIPHCDTMIRREAIIEEFSMGTTQDARQLRTNLHICPRQILCYKSGKGQIGRAHV